MCSSDLTPFRGNVAGWELHEDSTIFPVDHAIKVYCTVKVEVATTVAPVPTMRSFVCKEVGGFPVGAAIFGSLPAAPETSGSEALLLEAEDSFEDLLDIEVTPPSVLQLDRTIANPEIKVSGMI